MKFQNPNTTKSKINPCLAGRQAKSQIQMVVLDFGIWICLVLFGF